MQVYETTLLSAMSQMIAAMFVKTLARLCGCYHVGRLHILHLPAKAEHVFFGGVQLLLHLDQFKALLVDHGCQLFR